MCFINDKDYEFISNKYHDTTKPFDPFRRFVRNDSIFDESTGMNAEDILKGIYENDNKYKTLPHSIRKAKAMEYVLENTRILCDPKDLFPCINCIDRPLTQTLIKDWEGEVFENIIPDSKKEMDFLYEMGAARVWLDYDHSVPVWDRLLELGFSGILKDAKKAKAQLMAKRELTESESAFYDSIEIVYGAVIKLVGRLAELAKLTRGCEEMAKALKTIQHGVPSTFYEALMFEYVYFIVSEHIASVQARSLGNFDRLFYPYYKHDIENGVSEDVLKKQLAYFLFQFASIGNYWGQPVYLGGTDEDGNTNINSLSYAFLDVYDKLGIYTPKIQIKFSEKIPKDFTLKALDMVRHGHNSIVFASEYHMRKILKYNGFDEKEIVHMDVKGCYESLLHGGMDTEDQQINLLKPLEYALHGGRDGITGEMMGLEEPVHFENFEDLLAAYKRQLKNLIDRIINLVNSMEGHMEYINPTPLLSATFTSCLEKGKDANTDGGITNNTYMCLGGIATIADSLTAIKKFVYDKKIISLNKFTEILDNNFAGYEEFRNMLVNDKDKYGNNLPLPDEIAKEIVNFAARCIERRPNSPVRGGYWFCGSHIARGIYDLGKNTLASPDGRYTSSELSKNMSPTLGANHKGVTASVLTITGFDMMKIHLNASIDASVSASAAKGEEGLEAMYGLLLTFIKLGGQAMQINMVDAQTLRKAQKNPEQYKDIQVRVSGWNVLFNNVNKDEQDGFIRQAEKAGL